MKRLIWIGIALGIAAALAACNIDQTGQSSASQGGSGNQVAGSAQSGNGGPAQPRPTFDPTQAATMQSFNRLAVGILYLQDSQASAITKDQAAKLLPLFQDVQSNMQQARANAEATLAALPTATPGTPTGGFGGNGRFGGFRGNGDLDYGKLQTDVSSIQAVLTADQMSAINGLTQDQMTATLQKHGVNGGFGGGFFNGTPGAQRTPGARNTPSPDQIATFQALRQTNQPPAGNPVVDEVVKVLQGIVGS